MFPFSISYDPLTGVADMSHLLDAPAGANGRVRIDGGHFVTDKGRIRFNAVNLTGAKEREPEVWRPKQANIY